MTTTDFGTIADAGTFPSPKLPRWLQNLLERLRRRRMAIRTYQELYHLDDKLLYDIGIDPLDLRDAWQNKRSPSVWLEPIRKRFSDTHRSGA